jgi:hypothetical protein
MKYPLILLTRLTLATLVAAQTSPSKASEHCTLQGKVVQQRNEGPIRKVRVQLFGTGENEGTATDYIAITDAQGEFTINDVKAGNYRIRYDYPGFVDAEKPHHGDGMLLSLVPGQEINDLVFHMAPGAVITGKVTDSDSDPLQGVIVAALPPHIHRNVVPAASYAYTNDLGEYRIVGLSPNRYLVVAESFQAPRTALAENATGKSAVIYGKTYYPGTTDKTQAIPLDLHAGDEVAANISLELVHIFHVRGQVTNLPPRAEDDISVVLRPLDEDSTADIRPWPLDKDGKFDIARVLPGSYGIVVTLGGNGLSPRFMRGDITVQVNNADVAGLKVSLVPNAEVRGQFRTDNGQKIDWSQLEVRLYSRLLRGPFRSYRTSGDAWEAMDWEERSPDTRLKADGSFEMEAVPPDTYRLSIWSPALPAYVVKAVNVNGKDVSNSGFTVADESPFLDVVITANTATVDGIVVDDQNKPTPDVHVVCIPDGNRRERRDLYHMTTTDSRGRFTMDGLNLGQYQFFAVDEDADEDEVMDPEFVKDHEQSGEMVKVEEGQHGSVVLKLAGKSR